MFSNSGISCDLKLAIPGNATFIDAHTTGAQLELEFLNLFTVPCDVQVECRTAAGLLVYGSGSVWRKPITGMPRLTTWGSEFRVNEHVSKAAGATSGTDALFCYQLDYRFTGASGWNPPHFPTINNSVMTAVR